MKMQSRELLRIKIPAQKPAQPKEILRIKIPAQRPNNKQRKVVRIDRQCRFLLTVIIQTNRVPENMPHAERDHVIEIKLYKSPRDWKAIREIEFCCSSDGSVNLIEVAIKLGINGKCRVSMFMWCPLNIALTSCN